ncbi:hypothetical protein F2Q70_00026721 [Brassica cretica]|uniref:Uncharacterized protein n=1 Tax=Brassica cretica TaxID=69181 RepID=A0A8S9LGG6_BRACR|nr:hypothetical protein F2Q70_00026721 [Brassica cretica]
MMFVSLISQNIVDELVIIGYIELSIAMWRPTTVLISRSFALSVLVLKNGGKGVLDCCLQRFLKVQLFSLRMPKRTYELESVEINNDLAVNKR